jgi:transglutaminase-like putative cysteine protease
MNRTPLRPVFAFVLVVSLARGGEERPYDVKFIPPGLRVDAAAIVRDYSVTVDVLNRGLVEERGTIVYTIFRSEGRQFGEFARAYDKFSKIKELDGALYDAAGEEIRSLESDDVKDESDVSVFSLYDDVRLRSAELYHHQYPYSVRFTYRIRRNGVLNYPRWIAQRGREGVVHSRFEVILAENETLRYWTNADTVKPVVTLDAGRRHYIWEASGLPELSEGDLEEDVEHRTIVVTPAPLEFEIGGYPGTMASWKSFGDWCARLYDGKQTLPPQAKQEVASLLAGISSEREKAMRLYDYMQKRTRYVNVSLGLGSWEPYDASYVYQRGYGDCKALSNFMISLLAEAGIVAYPAVIDAGGSHSDVLVDFPSNMFNHVIVCVPFQKDSLWLECTSQIDPGEFLGSFTENRPALLLTPAGGILVRTPATTALQNLTSRHGQIQIRWFGDAKAALKICRTGNRTNEVRVVMSYGTKEERRRWYLTEAAVTGAQLLRSEVRGVDDHAGEVDVTAEFDMPRFGSLSGGRLFFQPNMIQRNRSVPRVNANRKSPVRMIFPRIDVDTFSYSLPAGALPEALPRSVSLDASFGTYSSASVMKGDSVLVYTRRLEIWQPEIPPGKYPEYVKFFREVVKADNAQVVLISR